MTLQWKTSDSISSNHRRISSKAVFAFVFYFIMPIISIFMIMFTYPELSDARLIGILQRTLPISVLLILVSQYQVRYEKGDKGRFILNEVYVLLVVLWIFALLGGEPIIHQTWEEYQFSLNIWNYLILILFVTGANVVYYALEYKAYSEKDVQHEGLKEGESADGPMEQMGVIITTVEIQ